MTYSTSAASTATPKTGFYPVNEADKLRIKLKTELHQLEKEIRASCFNDSMTVKILDWLNRFQVAIQPPAHARKKEIDVQHEFSIFAETVFGTDGLLDAIRGFLDECSILGSDGLTYSSYSYGIFRGTASHEHHNRSPDDRTDPTPFTYKPHIPVRHLINWLKRYGPIPVCKVTQDTYEQLLKQNKIPQEVVDIRNKPASANRFRPVVPPTTSATRPSPQVNAKPVPSATDRKMEKIRKLLEQEAAKKKRDIEDSAYFQEQEKGYQAQYKPIIDDAQNLKNNIHKENAEQSAKIKNMEKEEKAQTEAILILLNLEFEKAAKLEKELENLQKRQSQSQSDINKVKKQSDNLAQQIAETQRAIEESNRNRDRLKRILKTIAVVGVCIFATWALGEILAETSFGGAALPTKGRGMMLKGAFKFC